MQYVTYSLLNETTQRLGIARANRILNIQKLVGRQWGRHLPLSLLELIQMGPEVWQRVATLAEECLLQPVSDETGHSLEEVRLHAPIPRPAKNIVCLGLNYKSHMKETAHVVGREAKIPEVPVPTTECRGWSGRQLRRLFPGTKPLDHAAQEAWRGRP